MFHEPSDLEVNINQFALKTFARPFYRDFIKAANLKGNERVLDFGSGAGGPATFIMNELKKGGGWLTCVDISKKWLNRVKKNLIEYHNVDYKLGEITSLDIPDNAYDIICIHFVLHDIEREAREQVAAAMVRKLKKGGRVFMREPVPDNSGAEDMVGLFEKEGMKRIYIKNVKIPLSGNTIEVNLEKQQ